MDKTPNKSEEHYRKRFNELNALQKEAVKTTAGPVAVIAGPGTGKTELVGMRIANILRTTDTAPENILCLTYTDSGVLAMRQRLLQIIGSTAHKINIFTFHSFGSNIMNQNLSLFFDDIPFRAASSLMTHRILNDILATLPHGHLLSKKAQGEFISIGRAKKAISHIKQGGLTSEELQIIITNNDIDIAKIEKILSATASERISKNSLDKFSQAAIELADIERTKLPNDTPNLIDLVQNSLLRAINEADVSGKTAPLTEWKNSWFKKDSKRGSVLKTKSKLDELKAIKQVYEQYTDAMSRAQLYDYDDMILMTLAALKSNKELLYNLQEQYQYILIDEFQDTNPAQMQIIYRLIDNESSGELPNILIVGDDDQAIYGFQGADSGNITTFLEKIPKTKRITLKDNYRSSQKILDHARHIITKGEDRLENTYTDLNKELTAHKKYPLTEATINAYANISSERLAVANSVAELISQGEKASDIAVLARSHDELLAILPYFKELNIPVTYEKHDNALDLESIVQLENLTDFFILLKQQKLEEAQSLLPEILSHPAWGLSSETLWQLSVRAYKERMFWLDTMKTVPETTEIYDWLIETAVTIFTLPLDQALDNIVGNIESDGFKSPFYNYFFAEDILKNNPERYLLHLNALSAIREKLRDYLADDQDANLENFSDFIKLTRILKETISITQKISTLADNSVNLMTAHKAKGLEFDHVFVINAVDNKWGTSVKAGNQTYKFPENIHLNPAGDNLDERIRLFYVATTRAKKTLSISYGHLNEKGKATLRTSYLEDDEWEITDNPALTDTNELLKQAKADWSTRLNQPNQNLKDLLQTTLDNYRLNSTILNNFIDILNGGPEHFITQNLLHFPSAPSNDAMFGTAIHVALQSAHIYQLKNNQAKPIEDVIAYFETELKKMRFNKTDLPIYLDRGVKSLTAFLNSPQAQFNCKQRPEVNFIDQQAFYQNIPLTGKMDVFEIDKDNKTVSIIDYKTGSPSASWKGATVYEKVKLHKYKQQLMFYRLLIETSRDYANYSVKAATLSFVEPDKNGDIHTLTAEFDEEEYTSFKKLIVAVYQRIIDLDMPDVSKYSKDIKGIVEFENDLTN